MPIPNQPELVIENGPIEMFVLYEKNARDHKKNKDQIKRSMEQFGVVNAISIDQNNVIIAGHGRFLAAKELGLKTLPYIRLTHLSETQAKALRIADNKIALNATWDDKLLVEEIQAILDCDEVIELQEFGFETGEYDALTSKFTDNQDGATERIAFADRSKPSVTLRGFHWSWPYSKHAVICADALDREPYIRVLPEGPVACVMTDMPWNVPGAGHISMAKSNRHPDFEQGSGEKTRDEMIEMMTATMKLQAEFAMPGAVVCQWTDWRLQPDLVRVCEGIFDNQLNMAVWVKPKAGMGSHWRGQYELCCIFRNKGGKHKNRVMLGKYGRDRSNVWQFPAPSSFGSDRENLKFHPTCKNVQMIAEVIMDVTDRGDIVLDAFLGSGTTLLSAHQCGRIGRGIEIDPYYVDTAVRRMIKLTGEVPVLHTGQTWTEVQAERQQEGKGND